MPVAQPMTTSNVGASTRTQLDAAAQPHGESVLVHGESVLVNERAVLPPVPASAAATATVSRRQPCRSGSHVIERLIALYTAPALYRDLLLTLTMKEIRVRYKQSLMGFLWALLMPLLLVSAGAVARHALSTVSGGAMSASVLPVLVKSAPWAFFVAALRFSTDSLVKNSNLVTKIYFPREVVPYAAVLAALFDFAVAGVAIVVVLLIAHVGLSAQLMWVPMILFLLVVLTAGLGLLASCANLFFRDVKYLVEVFLTVGIFFTPVFFEARTFPQWAHVILLNPVGSLLEALNDVVVLHRPPDSLWLAYAGAWAVGVFLLAIFVFRATEPLFAEKI